MVTLNEILSYLLAIYSLSALTVIYFVTKQIKTKEYIDLGYAVKTFLVILFPMINTIEAIWLLNESKFGDIVLWRRK